MSLRSSRPAPDYLPVFVGGAPRTGTTLLSALICTSESCNPFAPEFHYLGTLGMALIQTLAIYDSSQRLLLADRESLIRDHVAFMRSVMDASWEALGRPRVLVLKHCKLTPLFGMLGRHMPDARFVASFRDARDTIASMVRAYERHVALGGPERQKYVDGLISQFNGYYAALNAAAANDLGSRLLVVDHEQLAAGRVDALASFLGLQDIDSTRLWQRAVFDVRALQKDSMFSEHWGAPLTREPIGQYARTLDEVMAARVLRETLSVSVAVGQLMAARERQSSVSQDAAVVPPAATLERSPAS